MPTPPDKVPADRAALAGSDPPPVTEMRPGQTTGYEVSVDEATEEAAPPRPRPVTLPPASSAPADTTAAGRPGAAPASESRPTRRSTRPPRRRDRLAAWLALVICLVVAAIPMLVNLHVPEVVHPAEARTLAMSTETWQRHASMVYDQWSFEPFVPTLDREPQWHVPPGTTWAHLGAFVPVDPSGASLDELTLRARLVSVGFALLAVAAVFWIGMSIGGLTTALLATFVCIANPVLLYHARLATPDMPHLGLALLSLAAAMWAIRPLKLPPSLFRQALGWVLCGLALGLAVLTGGLTELPTVLIPLLLVLVVCPHRVSHLLGLLAALLVAALALTPWALHVHGEQPDAWRAWVAVLTPAYVASPERLGPIVGERLVLVLLAMLPWTLWLVAGLAQPFSTSSAGSRVRMFLGWVWFVPVALLLLLAPGRPGLAELLMVLPAAAMVVGQVFRQYVDLSAEGRHARTWRLLRWPHIGVLLVLSIGLPAALHFEPSLVREQWLPRSILEQGHPLYWVGAGSALVLLVVLSARYAARHHPGRAVVCWAMWTVTAFVMVMIPLSGGELFDTPLREEGARLGGLPAEARVYHLDAAGDATTSATSAPPATGWWAQVTAADPWAGADRPSASGPAPVLRYYAGRPIERLSPDRLELAHADEVPVYVLTATETVPTAGLLAIDELPAAGLRLWRTLGRGGGGGEPRSASPDRPTTPTTAPSAR